MGWIQKHLEQRRDGLLREAEYLNKRLAKVHEQIIELNTQILPTLPTERTHGPKCGCYYCD